LHIGNSVFEIVLLERYKIVSAFLSLLIWKC